jgi:MFS family permease
MRTLLFFISRFVVSLADQFLLFVVPIMVYQSTQSVAWSSLAFAFETLPRVLYTPFAGVIADKYSPFKTVQSMMNIRCLLCVISLGLSLILTEGSLLFIIIGLSALVGVASTQSFISSEVLLPLAFTNTPFSKVQSWTQSVDQTAIVVGPMLAAIVFEFGTWSSVILISSLLFFIGQTSFYLWVKYSLNCIQVSTKTCKRNMSFLCDIRSALTILKTHKTLLVVIGQTALVNLVLGSTMATAAAMVTGKFELNPTSFGILQMRGAITSIIVLTLTALSFKSLSLNTIGRLSFTLVCLGGLLYSTGVSYTIFCLGFMIILGFDGMFNVYIRTIRQKIIPRSDYGKTTGVVVFLNNITKPLSGLVIGTFGFMASVESIIFTMVIFTAVIGGLLFSKMSLYLTN